VICEVHQFWQSYKMHLFVFIFLISNNIFCKKKKKKKLAGVRRMTPYEEGSPIPQLHVDCMIRHPKK
jgi:hypothetical protein